MRGRYWGGSLVNVTAVISTWLGRLSLRAVLLGGFIAVIGMTLALGAVSWLGQNRSVAAVNRLLDVDARIAELSLSGFAAMLKARRAEKDFQLLWREFGYYEARSRYVTLLQLNLADLRERMAAARGLSGDPDVIEQSRRIEQAVEEYERGLLKAIELYGQLGHVNTGLEGRFRIKAHEIESIVRASGEDRLVADLLMLRRHEKDYLLRGASKYADWFRDAVAQLKAHAGASRLTPALKDRVAGLADDYLAEFERYVRVDQQTDAARERYLAAANGVEPLLENLYIAANRLATATRGGVSNTAQTTTWAITWASLAAILFGICVALFVSDSIAKSVGECVDFASRIARGDLDTRIRPRGRNEFTTLAVALNAMSDALQTSRASLERRNRLYAALSQTNQTIVRVKDRDELFHEICRIAVVHGGLKIAYVGLIESNAQQVRPVAHAGPAEAFLDGIHIPLAADVPEGRGPIAVALRERRPYICNDLRTDPATAPWRERAERIGSRATAALPLYQGGHAAGVLSLHSESAGFFDDEITELLGEMATDISFTLDNLERERLRAQAEGALRLRNRAIDASVNAVVITNRARAEDPIEFVNPAFERITGYSAAEVHGRNCSFLQGQDREQPAIETIRAALRERREGHAVLRNYRKDGTLFWNDLRIAPIPNENGLVTHYVGVINDITEARNYEEQLKHQANFDALTGLPNRNLLQDRIAQALAYARRQSRSVAIAWLDLDHFKLVNDSLGHSAGDALLKIVGERLRACVRSSDTVARLGGDEFVLVLPDQAGWETSSRVVQRVAESVSSDPHITETVQRLLGVVSTPVVVEGQELHVTCSVGLSIFPQDGEDVEVLLKNADAAMYRAKDLGRNNFQFYAAEMNARTGERLAMQAQLRRALEADEFLLHYQPKVDLQSGQITGLEALIRWNNSTLGLVPPDRFIPVLEQSGLMGDVGRWVIEKALSAYAHGLKQDPNFPRIAANVSPVQLMQKDFVAMLETLTRKYGTDTCGLDLEITESLIMKNIEENVAKLKAIRKMGIGIAVDDFGTGYSSLAYLARLPVDTLKIDRAFITDLAANPDSVTIVTTIISLAHALKLKVVAEGVETEEQRALLALFHCDAIQGYLVTRPVPLEHVIELLRRFRANTP